MKKCKQDIHPICESSDSKLAICVCWCAECKECHQNMPIKLCKLADSTAAAAKECNGSRYDSPKDGKHLWVHPNFDKPAVCYYCSAKEVI